MRSNLGLLGEIMEMLMMRKELDQIIADIFIGLKCYVETGVRHGLMGKERELF